METPQKMRPTSSTLKLLKCFVKQPKEYVATYVSAAFFRPLHASDSKHGHQQRCLCDIARWGVYINRHVIVRVAA